MKLLQGGGESNCGLPKFFISFNLILCVIVSAVSILPQVQEALPNSGLLQSAVVTLYTMYLTWSAVANNPNIACNPGFLSFVDGHKQTKVTFDSSSIVGLVVWILCILYSSLRSASRVAGIPDVEKQGMMECFFFKFSIYSLVMGNVYGFCRCCYSCFMCGL